MTHYNPDIYHRQSIRIRGYDYSKAGAYFVTICTKNRECLFGAIRDEEMHVNELGVIIQQCWEDLPDHYVHMELDAFVIMPNHVHGIIVLNDGNGRAGLKPALLETSCDFVC
jgi:putative transposase